MIIITGNSGDKDFALDRNKVLCTERGGSCLFCLWSLGEAGRKNSSLTWWHLSLGNILLSTDLILPFSRVLHVKIHLCFFI